jgi:hypothetical protein
VIFERSMANLVASLAILFADQLLIMVKSNTARFNIAANFHINLLYLILFGSFSPPSIY